VKSKRPRRRKNSHHGLGEMIFMGKGTFGGVREKRGEGGGSVCTSKDITELGAEVCGEKERGRNQGKSRNGSLKEPTIRGPGGGWEGEKLGLFEND